MRLLAVCIVLAGCSGSTAVGTDAVTSPDGAASPGDAATDASGDGAACVPGCHWDCFGGSQCVNGTAWLNLYAPRACCTFRDPWPGTGPVCSLQPIGCPSGSCSVPDPRYATCLRVIGTPRTPCPGGQCEYMSLYCDADGPAVVGSPCEEDRDCRPAAEGVAALSCETTTHTCVAETRPPAPEGYGASCGLTAGEVALIGEAGLHRGDPDCEICQVYKESKDGCLRQGCTMACTYDEDCPTGSVCLCGLGVAGYCAAATDRETAPGRAAGLTACQD